MNFFKKIFKKEEKPAAVTKVEIDPRRKISLSICETAGFKPAGSLPTNLIAQARPSLEIAKRLHAIKALVLWLLVPEEELASERILDFVERNELREFLAEEEIPVLEASRDDADLRNMIGWKFENAWPLAWYFGFREPDITGEMMTGDKMQEILTQFTSALDEPISEWLPKQNTRSDEELLQKEDLFYCLHNAVRSSQLGYKTVPSGFDPISNGGVIHERRHSLTWMLSKDDDWDDTELST